jgi:DNA-binding transcriptional LysR family regulator
MVGAGEGIALIPSFAAPFCDHRKVVISKLTNPVVNLDFYQITNRGKRVPDVPLSVYIQFFTDAQ